MSWDYWTYINQPAIFVNEIWVHMAAESEAEHRNQMSQQAQRASNVNTRR